MSYSGIGHNCFKKSNQTLSDILKSAIAKKLSLNIDNSQPVRAG